MRASSLEAREAVGAGRRHELQRDVAAQAGVAPTPHLAHAAFADGGDDLV